MFHCPTKSTISAWLLEQLRKLGCQENPENFIRGHIGTCRQPRSARMLIAAYMHLIWEKRENDAVPTIEELKSLWQTLHTHHDTNTTH